MSNRGDDQEIYRRCKMYTHFAVRESFQSTSRHIHEIVFFFHFQNADRRRQQRICREHDKLDLLLLLFVVLFFTEYKKKRILIIINFVLNGKCVRFQMLSPLCQLVKQNVKKIKAVIIIIIFPFLFERETPFEMLYCIEIVFSSVGTVSRSLC